MLYALLCGPLGVGIYVEALLVPIAIGILIVGGGVVFGSVLVPDTSGYVSNLLAEALSVAGAQLRVPSSLASAQKRPPRDA